MQPAATNTFQCVLATNGTSSFVLFLYADGLMNWIASDQDGTYPALVGFNAGDGVASLTLPTSRTERVLDITMRLRCLLVMVSTTSWYGLA